MFAGSWCLGAQLKAMREHWHNCQLKWPAPYIHCSPGYSHPKCEEGVKLEKEYLKSIKGKYEISKLSGN